MSVKDLNLVYNVSSAMTGEVVFVMKKNDYLENGYARDYFYSKIDELLIHGDGAIIKEGYKN